MAITNIAQIQNTCDKEKDLAKKASCLVLLKSQYQYLIDYLTPKLAQVQSDIQELNDAITLTGGDIFKKVDYKGNKVTLPALNNYMSVNKTTEADYIKQINAAKAIIPVVENQITQIQNPTVAESINAVKGGKQRRLLTIIFGLLAIIIVIIFIRKYAKK